MLWIYYSWKYESFKLLSDIFLERECSISSRSSRSTFMGSSSLSYRCLWCDNMPKRYFEVTTELDATDK